MDKIFAIFIDKIFKYILPKELEKILTLSGIERQLDAMSLIIWSRIKYSKWQLVLGDFIRSNAKQDGLFEEGSKRTTVRGKQAKHPLGKAFDLYYVSGKRILEYHEAPYKALGEEWIRRGNIWGGSWKVPFDPGHFEFK